MEWIRDESVLKSGIFEISENGKGVFRKYSLYMKTSMYHDQWHEIGKFNFIDNAKQVAEIFSQDKKKETDDGQE